MNSIFQDVDIRSYMPSNVEYMVVEVKVTSFLNSNVVCLDILRVQYQKLR